MEYPISRLTRRERKRDLTRARLYEAALDEFRRTGFDRSSVARIARRAGVSRASFYFHFPTKEHVLTELQWSLELRMAERIAGGQSLRAALQQLVEGAIEVEASVGDAELFRDMLKIYVRKPDGLPLEELASPVLDELQRQFVAGAANRELRAGLEPEQATHLCLTSFFGFLISTAESSATRRADLEALVSLYLEDGEA
jgi:TetR/AcrR family transcriptional repressor of uid operon